MEKSDVYEGDYLVWNQKKHLEHYSKSDNSQKKKLGMTELHKKCIEIVCNYYRNQTMCEFITKWSTNPWG